MGRRRIAVLGCALTILLTTALTSSASAGTLQPRVVNGTPSDGSDSFLVALLDPPVFKSEGGFQAQFCGGTLTTPTVVVTAAHCVREDNGALLQPQDILVGVGGDLDSPALRTFSVTSVIVHPGYVADSAINDIAVLTLATPVTGARRATCRMPGRATGGGGGGAARQPNSLHVRPSRAAKPCCGSAQRER
jgi:secreted trypsin-like serine protease